MALDIEAKWQREFVFLGSSSSTTQHVPAAAAAPPPPPPPPHRHHHQHLPGVTALPAGGAGRRSGWRRVFGEWHCSEACWTKMLPRSQRTVDQMAHDSKTTLDGNVNDAVANHTATALCVRITDAVHAVCTSARVMYVCEYRLLPNVSR